MILIVHSVWYNKNILKIKNFLNILNIMIINDKNQNDIFDEMEIDYVFANNPINGVQKIDEQENKTQLLVDLEKKIQNIENCELKKC